MNIYIFDNIDRFTEHPVSKGPGSRVLDYTRDPEAKKKWPGYYIALAPFSPEEKQGILEEYVELISRLGMENGFSIYWLCHLISEKNELLPRHLLSRIVDFIRFHTAFNNCTSAGKSLVMVTPNPVLATDVRDFARERGISFYNGGEFSCQRTYSRGIRGILAVARNQYRWFREKRLKARRWKFLSGKIDRSASYTVFRTWFDHRSPVNINNDRDIYYGRLPGFLMSENRKFLFYGDVLNTPMDRDTPVPPEGLKHPLLLEGAFLKLSDVFRAVLFRLRCRFKTKFSDSLSVHQVALNSVMWNFFLEGLNHRSLTENYFTYIAAKRMLKCINVQQVFNIFENYAWEKVTVLAVKEQKKKVPLVGFQHAQVALSSVKFFYGSHGVPDRCFPDRLLTLGRVTRDFLVNRKHYPPVLTVPGCALRHDNGERDNLLPRKRHGRVVVTLWTFERSLEMLRFLFSCETFRESYRIMIRTHPNYPVDKLQPHLDFDISSTFEKSRGMLDRDFQVSDAVVYSGTTVCLDALARGVPVINVEFDDFVSPDPLFDFHDFKWTVTDENGVMAAISEIHALNDEQYFDCQEKALKHVNDYFYPVTSENMKKFLI